MIYSIAKDLQSPTPCDSVEKLAENCTIFDRWTEVFPMRLQSYDEIQEDGAEPQFNAIALGGNYESFLQTIGIPPVALKCVGHQLPTHNIAHYHSASHRYASLF